MTRRRGDRIGLHRTGHRLMLLALLLALAASAVLVAGDHAGAREVLRLAGPDRFATAASVSRTSFPQGAPVAFVATGHDFPDALAAAPVAALRGGPLLLTARDALPAATSEELDRLRPAQIVILGGPAVVGDAVEQALAGRARVQRLWGSDRFATAAAVSRATFATGVGRVFVATGRDFADALTGGAAAAAGRAPVLLVERDRLPDATAAELERLAPTEIVVLGGPRAVSSGIEAELRGFATAPVRRLAGEDRYASSAAISRALFDAPVSRVLLATGIDFPDGLAGGVAAGSAGEPLLLVPGTCVTHEVAAEIDRLSPAHVVLVGGPAALAQDVENLQACDGERQPQPSPTQPEPSPTQSPAPPPPTPSPDGATDSLPLGTYTEMAFQGRCPDGSEWTCTGFEVACPDVAAVAGGELAVAGSTSAVRGMVVLFSGGEGTGWWSLGSTLTDAFTDDLRARGFEVVQVRWEQPGWWTASAGELAGPQRLACRPATVVHHLHATRYAALGVDGGATGRCGFCVTGNSGGASQVSYLLSHYGQETILDAVVPTSGPPHAALARGCLREPGDGAYWFSGAASRRIDVSYGFLSGGGPCEQHDAVFEERWDSDSVDTGALDLVHPQTRVHFVFGAQDPSEAKPHGQDYLERLQQAGSPLIDVTEVASMAHRVQDDSAGLDALTDALVGAD